jgi:predicted Rossmann fold nucleotide-binding protein DprA/Smf involved in DNA uptake
MAVPGPVGSPVSEGTNRLLVDGVAPALGADEVLIALNLTTTPRLFTEPKKRRVSLSAEARRVLDVLDFVAMPTDRVVEASGLARGTVMVALQELLAARRATGGGGWWSRAVDT